LYLGSSSLGGFPVLEQHGVRGADVLLVVVVANDLHVVGAELDLDALVGRAEEAERVEGELELGAHAHEDAALRLDAVLPAELEGQDVLVLVGLQRERGGGERGGGGRKGGERRGKEERMEEERKEGERRQL